MNKPQVSAAVFAQLAEAAKPSTKTAAKKTAEKKAPAKAAAKTEAKPTEKKASTKGAAVTKGAANVIAYGIHNGSRPAAGRMLFAFTHAWLSASGLASGGSISRASATRIAGSTAIGYHLANGNMAEDAKGMVTLTAKGQNFFGQRAKDGRVCEKMTGAYVEALKTGKPQDGIIPKNADEFVKL